MVRRSTLPLIVSLALAGMAAGCRGKLTRQQYETIYVGQPACEVARALGEPEERSDRTWTYVREMPFRKVVVTFKDERVVHKAWSVRSASTKRHGEHGKDGP